MYIFCRSAFSFSIMVDRSTCQSVMALEIFSHTFVKNFFLNQFIYFVLASISSMLILSTICTNCSPIVWSALTSLISKAYTNISLISWRTSFCLSSLLFCSFLVFLYKICCMICIFSKLRLSRLNFGAFITSSKSMSFCDSLTPP